MARQPIVGQDHLIIEVSRSQSDSPQSVGLLWTSDQPDAEASNRQHTTLRRNRHPDIRRDSNPQFQQARDRRPTTLDRAAAGVGCNWPRIRELFSELMGCQLALICRPYRQLHCRYYVVFTLNPSLISITSSFDMQHLLRMFFNNGISLTTARDLTLSSCC
jgi:hypothetical protein